MEHKSEKVEILRTNMRISVMRVCATFDATDEEILDVCNVDNVDTANGWTQVLREGSDTAKTLCPEICASHPGKRKHFIVLGE